MAYNVKGLWFMRIDNRQNSLTFLDKHNMERVVHFDASSLLTLIQEARVAYLDLLKEE